jgi:hypothetical protein
MARVSNQPNPSLHPLIHNHGVKPIRRNPPNFRIILRQQTRKHLPYFFLGGLSEQVFVWVYGEFEAPEGAGAVDEGHGACGDAVVRVAGWEVVCGSFFEQGIWEMNAVRNEKVYTRARPTDRQ